MTSAAGTETDRDVPNPGETSSLTTGDFESFPPSVVRDAAERVWAAWTNELGDAVDRDEAFEVLLGVTAGVADAIEGETPDPAPNTFSVLGRRFLELIRRDFINQWAGTLEPPSSITVLEVMSALERMAAIIDADWSSYFTSRLSGPDGQIQVAAEIVQLVRNRREATIVVQPGLADGEDAVIQRQSLDLGPAGWVNSGGVMGMNARGRVQPRDPVQERQRRSAGCQ